MVNGDIMSGVVVKSCVFSDEQVRTSRQRQ